MNTDMNTDMNPDMQENVNAFERLLDGGERRLPAEAAYRFCSRGVAGYQVKAYLENLHLFGAVWQVRQLDGETVYAVTERESGRTQCNTLCLDGEYFSALIFYEGLLSEAVPHDADAYYSHEYRFF